MSGKIASAAVGAMARDAMPINSASISKAIGKPLEQLGLSSRPPGLAEINWVDFNYPPLIRLIHYNTDELPSTLVGVVRGFHLSWILTLITCLLNVLDVIIIIATTQAPALWLLQSFLNLILLPVAALFTFYCGYRGLAEPDSGLICRFKFAQPFLGVVYFFFFLVPWGSINGFVKLTVINDYSSGSTYWVIAIVVESLLWLLNTGLAAYNVVRSSHIDVYGTSSSSASRF